MQRRSSAAARLVQWFDPPDAETRRLRLDQIGLAVSAFRLSRAGLLIAILCIAVISARWQPAPLVFGWTFCATFCLALANLITGRIAREKDNTAALALFSVGYFVASIVMVGVVVSASVLFWMPGDAQNHMLCLLMPLVSLSIGVVQSASYPPACALNAVYGIAGAALCFREGGETYLIFGLVVLLVCVIMGAIAFSIFLTTTSMLQLRQSAHAMVETQRDLVERLQEASRTKSEFLANMSHELRTPLNAILGFSDVMRKELLGPMGTRKYIGYAEDINASGTHLLSLINDILDLSKIEAGKFELKESEVDLHAVVEEATRMISERAREGRVTQINEVPEGIILRADATALRQVAINIANNAVKFTPPGGTVRASVLELPDGRFAVAVSDSGCGIPAADLELVFENFGQARHDHAVAEKGTGLGLPIVRSLMRAHGGDAWLESTLGEGTTVYLSLPAERIVSFGLAEAA